MKFIYEPHDLRNFTQGEISFRYTLEQNEKTLHFCETLTFDPTGVKFQELQPDALKNILNSLRLFLGISYWKLHCPKDVEIIDNFLTQEQANFWNMIYTTGMGEFYYKNKLDFDNALTFPIANEQQTPSPKIETQNRSLVFIGGGKDSLVSAELLRQYHKDFSAFTFGTSRIQDNTIKILNAPRITINRKLDPQIIELSKQPGAYNGHVPISLGYALVGLLAAILYDFRYVIASNEESANAGNNIEYLGKTINHQWSKSFEAEQATQSYAQKFITPSITYFSILRPIHEIKIVQYFSQFEKYFSIFSSCNKNFTQTNRITNNWCCNCAKCAFVYAMMSAFVTPTQMSEIFSENLFDKESLIPIFQELLGLKDTKPFDCVGTPEETIVAFTLAHQTGAYEETPAMKMFVSEILEKQTDINSLINKTFSTSEKHNIPEEFQSIIENFKNSKIPTA